MQTPERIAETLRASIRRGELPPGTLLVQDELAKRFEVSRNPLREALRTLGAEGLVEIRPGRRAVVRQLTPAEIAELYELRAVVEPLLAAPIIAATAPRDLGRLRSLAQAVAASPDVGEWLDANFAFHSALFGQAGRPRTEEICISLMTASQPYSALNVGALHGRADAERQHTEMLDAIEARDADRLASLFTAHLLGARERLLDSTAATL